MKASVIAVYKLFIASCVINATVAIAKFSHGYLGGYYCVRDYFKTIFNISRHICTLSCMDSDACFLLAYHHQRYTCSLGHKPCVIAEAREHHTTMVLRANLEQNCLVWNQWDTFNDFPRVVSSDTSPRSVARNMQETSIFVGTMNYPGDGVSFFAIGGNEIMYQDSEPLSVHPNCSLAWMPYTVGDPLPKRAMATGNIEGRVAYSIRVGSLYDETFGFYYKGEQAGYYGHYGYHEVLDFDVLINV